jgi:hypothetical protein
MALISELVQRSASEPPFLLRCTLMDAKKSSRAGGEASHFWANIIQENESCHAKESFKTLQNDAIVEQIICEANCGSMCHELELQS